MGSLYRIVLIVCDDYCGIESGEKTGIILMAAQNKLFQRLIWLADTIYSAKHITMEEIDSRWSKSPYNNDHESHYGKRNFSRHKDTIAELFGIEIVCDRATNRYSINDVSRPPDRMCARGLSTPLR